MCAVMEGESLKMKTWDEISEAVNVTYEQTLQVDETAKIVLQQKIIYVEKRDPFLILLFATIKYERTARYHN